MNNERDIGMLLGVIEGLKRELKLLGREVGSLRKDLKDHMIKEEAEKEETTIAMTKLKTYTAIAGFLIAVVVPSIWTLIWANILNKDALEAFLSSLPSMGPPTF